MIVNQRFYCLYENIYRKENQMIAPQPFKYKCPKCNYTKIVKPKSDALNIIDFSSSCPKCGMEMERVELNIAESLVSKIKR